MKRVSLKPLHLLMKYLNELQQKSIALLVNKTELRSSFPIDLHSNFRKLFKVNFNHYSLPDYFERVPLNFFSISRCDGDKLVSGVVHPTI